MSEYKDKIECGEYVPVCILNELERLNNEIIRLNEEIVKLKRGKVDVTKIVPHPDTGICPLGLPDPPDSHDN